MSIKGALHKLIDELDEGDAAEVLSYAQGVVLRNGWEASRQRFDPGVAVSGQEFFSAAPKDLDTLAREQGVKPIEDIDSLRGDFWPEDESTDEFIQTIRQWRRGG